MRTRLLIIIALAVLGIAFPSVFKVMRMPGHNMEKSIPERSILLIYKFSYRIVHPLTYQTITALSKPEVNQLICFFLPSVSDPDLHNKPLQISRLAGTPGDSIYIFQGMVFNNRKKLNDPVGLQKKYRLFSPHDLKNNGFAEKYGITNLEQASSAGLYDLALTKSMAEQMVRDSLVNHLRMVKETQPDSRMAFPESPYFAYSNDFYGPVRIPFKGLTIKLDYKNIDLYQRIISVYEGKTVEVNAGRIYINHTEAEEYTFDGNYFFVLDDNRDFSHDSRRWGFLPENHILGKVIYY